MRVIAGTAKRIQLHTLDGLDTRPTTDRIKETLFNMIAPDIYDCSFLDLFSGSGAIGIEALSRGAKEAVFVENSRKASDCIRANLQKTKLHERGRILTMDAVSAVKKLDGQARFDYIFMDPPYHQELERRALEALATSALLDDQTVIIVEAALDTSFSYIESLGYMMLKNKEYKTNKHIFLAKKGGDIRC